MVGKDKRGTRGLQVAASLLCVVGLSLSVAGQGGDIRKATLKKIDFAQQKITLVVDGKEQEFVISEATLTPNGKGQNLRERLQRFKEGANILFKAGKKDGKDFLVGLKLAENAGQAPPPFDTSKLKPLTEMDRDTYQGFAGGLYPDGQNQRPAAHEAAGLRLAKQVQPLDATGKPAADGKIVLLSVGMSNTSQASQAFEKLLNANADKNPRLLFVNGAQGGMTAVAIQDPDDGKRGTQYWKTVDERLKKAGVTREQVQAIWIKQADAGPSQGFPKYAQTLQAELTKIVQMLPTRFPNLKMVYLSSRTYGGYAKTKLNPEPYAFESGFSVQWLIAQQIKGDPGLNYDPAKGAVKAPWLSWGPYLWANGNSKRIDGFSYAESDYGADGTHPSPAGMQKLGQLLLRFFQNDTTTRTWFQANAVNKDR